MIRSLVVLLLLPLAAVAQEAKGTQYAFLVGCSGYAEAKLTPLPYTVNDVEQFRQALLETGFEADHIKMLHDKQDRRFQSERAKIVKEFATLLDGLKPEDTVIVALSGHGVQLKKEGVSYFCPLDADLEDKATLIPLDGKGGLFEQLKACPAKRKLLIVNACRDVRDIPGKRAQAAEKIDLDDFAAAVPEGIAAIYSCKAGQKSYYDPKRHGGIFFDHVTRAWRGEYADAGKTTDIEAFFREVSTRTKADVDKTYGEAQVPEVKREYKEEWRVPVSAIVAEFRESEAAAKSPASLDKWTKQVSPARLREWRRLAEGGNVMGMQLTARCLMTGAGTPKDETAAVEWFRKAAGRGHGPAMNNLGVCYFNGRGVGKDIKQAVEWYRLAADLGVPAAMNNYGYSLATGLGVDKDETAAIAWYRKSADQGVSLAMTNLGQCYRVGRGVAKDDAQAIEWLRKAAALGEPGALYSLGYCCEHGAGVTKDEGQAVEWYRKAVAAGNPMAMTNLGLCYREGRGVGKDEREALNYFHKSADLGEPVGTRQIGYCYEAGLGVARDAQQAAEWYRKAAKLGDKYAQDALARLGYSP